MIFDRNEQKQVVALLVKAISGESMPSLLQVPTCSSTVVSSLLSARVNIN